MTPGDASRATGFQTSLMSGNWLPKIKLEVKAKMSWTGAKVGSCQLENASDARTAAVGTCFMWEGSLGGQSRLTFKTCKMSVGS